MDIWPGEAISTHGVWYPVKVSENIDAHEIYVDNKDARLPRIATFTNATATLAAEEIRQQFGNPRVWFVTGEIDGVEETWLLRHRPGCGCGSTGQREALPEQLALLGSS